MVVQTVDIEQKEDPIEYIHIPEKIPEEIIENDSLLTIESNLNKLEDKVVLTARNVLGLTNEMKIQLFELERIEKAMVNMHEYMLSQNKKIVELQNQVTDLELKNEENHQERGFWARLFSKN